MKHFKLIIGLALMHTLIGQAQSSSPRPNACWVRRSVLDGRPRIVTLMLHKDFYAAYDGQSGGIYKLWKNGVDFVGSVYNTKHGPQPMSIGKSYTECNMDIPVWKVLRDGKPVQSEVQFRGYYWKGDVVRFKYEISAEDIEILVEETPSVAVDAKGIATFQRTFRASSIPAGMELYVLTQYDKMLSMSDVSVEGESKVISKTEYMEGAKTLFALKHQLKLKPSVPVSIRSIHNPEVLN